MLSAEGVGAEVSVSCAALEVICCGGNNDMRQTNFHHGASSGIGLAAKLFQAKGWNVVATMRKPKMAGNLAGLANMLITRLDVTDTGRIEGRD